MSMEDPLSAAAAIASGVAPSASAVDDKDNIAVAEVTAITAAQSSNDDSTGLSSSDTMPSSNMEQPRLRVHPEESVAYITVSDPVQHTEGLKGKYTMYRVAYDPPPPTADADTNTSNGSNNKALFPYATSVNRRYSDFSWLFEHLHKERPGAIVPPLPEKQKVSRFTEQFIEERRLHLEIFLRGVACNPELVDTECLLIFLGGGDAEFKKAKKDGSFGTAGKTNVDATLNQTLSDDYNDEMRDDTQQAGDPSIMDKMKPTLSHKKKGLKKWIKEKKTTMQGTMVRSPDDAVFEQVTHFIAALEAGLKRVEAQASAMVKRDKDVSSSLLEFGLGCDALAHIDDEINGSGVENEAGSSGIGQTFRFVGKAADAASSISADHYEREFGAFAEPLRDHLKMVHAVKIALMKRNNRRITYSTCLNAVDSKKASLHKYRITPGQEGKAYGVEGSLSRAENSVLVAKANYEEVSARVLREVDRFRKDNAIAMYATMVEFARAQKEYHNKMNEAWGALLPEIESADATQFNGSSFAQAARAMNAGNIVSMGGGNSVEAVTAQVDDMTMPSYPPPPEPAAVNGVQSANAMESSMLNGAVRYRDPLPEE